MEEQSAQAQNANHEATCSLQQPTSRSLLLASLSRGLNERQVWTNRPCGQRVRPLLWVRVQASTNRRHFRKDFVFHRKGKEWIRRNALAKGNGEALTKRTGKNKIKMTYRDSQNCMQNFTQELYSLIKRILNQRGVGGRRGDEKVGMGGYQEVTCSRSPAIPIAVLHRRLQRAYVHSFGLLLGVSIQHLDGCKYPSVVSRELP